MESHDKGTGAKKNQPTFSPPTSNGKRSLCRTSWIRISRGNDTLSTTYAQQRTETHETDKILTEAFRLFCLWNHGGEETTRNGLSFTFMICIRSRIMSLSIQSHRAFLLSLLCTFEARMRGRDRAPTPISSRISPRLGFQSIRNPDSEKKKSEFHRSLFLIIEQ